MGIFSTPVMESSMNFKSEIVANESLQDLMEDSSLNSVYSENADLEECALSAVIDMNENFNMIQKAIGCQELNCLESTGQDFEYTEPVLEGFLDSIKNFLKKVWEKIRALFKKFMMMFDSYAKNDKEFVTKYKKEIYSGKSLEDFEFKGYTFANLVQTNIDSVIGKCSIEANGKLDSMIKAQASATTSSNYDKAAPSGRGDSTGDEYKKRNELYDDDLESWRGSILGKGKLTEEEYRKELKEYFYGSDEKEDLDKIDLAKYAQDLMTSAQAKKDLKTAYKGSEDVIKKDEKLLEGYQKTMWHNNPNKDDDEPARKEKSAWAAGLNLALKWTHATKATLITTNGIILNAIKDRSRQHKACITKAVYYKPKGESSYTESASNYSASVGDFLGGIVLK